MIILLTVHRTTSFSTDNKRMRKMLIMMDGKINAGRDTKKTMILEMINGFVLNIPVILFIVMIFMSIMPGLPFVVKICIGW